MSLLKKKNGDKSKGSDSPPSTPIPTPVFRRSTSFDPVDAERPHSQQSGYGVGGNKKKMIPSFLSNLFGNGNKVPVVEEKSEPNSLQPIAEGEKLAVSGKNKKSTSHESINSVQSSSSFSFVNPTKLGGKRAKGKRIPVDDPNYGRTTNNSKNTAGATDSSKKFFGNTLDRIGMKIGLKKKYNLQSCESLQYIDACDEPLPIVAGTTSEVVVGTFTLTHDDGNDAVGSQGQSASVSQSQTEKEITYDSDAGQTDTNKNVSPVVNAEFSANCLVRQKHVAQTKQTEQEINPVTLPDTQVSKISNMPEKTYSESSAQTVTPTKKDSISLPIAEVDTKIKDSPTAIKPIVPIVEEKIVKEAKPSKNEIVSPLNNTTTENSKIKEKVTTSTQVVSLIIHKSDASSFQDERKKSIESQTTIVKQDEQKPCTSRSIFREISPSPPKETAKEESFTSLLPTGNSNTWGNSNRRKRRAPQPPANENSFPQKFSNGTTCTDNGSSVIADIPNDVPSSSSQVALLTKFTRIEESPPPTHDTAKFEIRPRKKEKSLEPPPVTRPTSSFATPSHSNFKTLFSSHHHRYQQHKRSCSEGFSTNTKGRVHKPGKKKAPAPPNPFGDPDDEMYGECTNDAELSTDHSTHFTSTPMETLISSNLSVTQSSVSSLPPQKPKQTDNTSKQLHSNPFAAEHLPTTSNTDTAANSSAISSPHSSSPVITGVPKTTSKASTTILSPTTGAAAFTSTSSYKTAPTSTSTMSTPSTTLSNSTSTSNEIVLVADDTEELDEIRQNMLNDEHERQQLGLLQEGASANAILSEPTSTAIESPSSSTSANNAVSITASSPQSQVAVPSSSNSQITDTDIQAAQNALASLSVTVAANSSGSRTNGTIQTPDPNAKAKLAELKKEADRSSFNNTPPSKNKSRPSSIGSSIYESPLAILFGKSSSNGSSNKCNNGNNNNDTIVTIPTVSSGESSPKISSKPWYKRGGTGGLSINPFTSNKPKQTTPIKPFTSLVKFSELDKEATRIVEENKRKSAAEQRFSESDQDELDELFSSTIAAGNENISRSDNYAAPETGESSRHSSAPTRVLTTAQVHPIITEENDNLLSENVQASSSNTALQTTGSSSTAPSENKGNSSPPTFQSVHAASKHRQIKPLLSSSPITNIRSEKLAIVQPQANLSTLTPPTTSQGNDNSTTLTSSIVTSSSSTISVSSSSSKPSYVATTVVSKSITTSSTKNSTTGSSDSEWDCPRCTLKNPNWRILCEICFQRRDTTTQLGSYMSSILQRVNSEANSNRAAAANTPISSAQSSIFTPSTSTYLPTSNKVATTSSTHSKSPQILASSSLPSSSPQTIITSTKTLTTTTNSVTSCLSTSQCIPSAVEQFQGPSVNTTVPKRNDVKENVIKPSSSKVQASTTVKDKQSADIPLPPASENFLSQLPPKQDITKGEKLQGIKLHEEDPELEELDISKLREARLAYFQKRESSNSPQPTITSSTSPPPISSDTSNTVSNDLDSNVDVASNKIIFTMSPSSGNDFHSNDNNVKENNSPRCCNIHKNTAQVNPPTSSLSAVEQERKAKRGKDNKHRPHTTQHHRQTFSDNEDDFLDNMLQLDNTNDAANAATTNVANILNTDNTTPTGLLPCPPCMPTSAAISSTSAAGSSSNSDPPPTLLQNRYRPKLEAIREGNSQDYTYCYSSSEIAQIYENWQASQKQNNSCSNFPTSNKNVVASSIPSGIIPLQQQDYHPLVVTGNNIHTPSQCNNSNHSNVCSGGGGSNIVVKTHPIPILMTPLQVDHQPYSNNRLPDSPEENYVNAAFTPTFNNNETVNFVNASIATASPIAPICLSAFPMVGQQNHQESSRSAIAPLINCNNIAVTAVNPHQQNSLSDNRSNYENNNMSLNPGTSAGRLSYEDYKRMGAIPKGFQFNSRQTNDDWSSESSGDTDSSRGLWGRGYGDFQGFFPGSGPMVAPDFSQVMDFAGLPDQSHAVGKLMKRLEAAIANGDHRLAATLAHDLALMKVNCVVSKINQPFSIRVYVEDRCMQQGPFLVQVSTMMTVRDLKEKIETDWGIPSGFQKWILGRKMAEDDSLSLTSCEMAPDSMAFLFLVTPEVGNALNGTLPDESKLANTKTPMVVSDRLLTPSSSTFAAATSSLNRNLGSAEDKKLSNSSSKNNIPTGHTYDVIPEGEAQHLYNNLDNKIKESNKEALKPKTPGATKKTSTAAQTASTSVPTQVVVPAQGTSPQCKVKELTPPPPLPPKSPIPPAVPSMSTSTPNNNLETNVHITKQKTLVAKTDLNSARSGIPSADTGNLKQLNRTTENIILKKQNSSAQKATVTNGEPTSAATILTQSLQQKLAEFKAIAEHTFGKTGINVLPRRSASKERSPAPPVIAPSLSKVETSLKKSEDAKPVTKRSSRAVTNSSKERLATSAPGSIEKLARDSKRDSASPAKPITLENRFNGILLPSSDTPENVKPPERLDRGKSSNRAIVSPEKVVETKPELPKKEPAAFKKPPIPPQPELNANISSSGAATKFNIVPIKIENNSESEELAPQPKPRVLRKQHSTPEKISEKSEAIVAIVDNSPIAPVPAPRTSHVNVKTKLNLQTDLPEEKVIPSSKEVQQAEKVESQNQDTQDDFCQTTLPFPALRHNKPSNENTSNNDGDKAATGQTCTAQVVRHNITPTTKTGNGSVSSLLRPSAFVSQIKSESNNSNYATTTAIASPNSSSVLLPILTANFTNANAKPLASFSSPEAISSKTNNAPNAIAIAHVQPLNVTPKPSSTPTAYVSPSSSATSSGTPSLQQSDQEQVKKEDDSAQSFLKMLELMEKQDIISTTDDADCPVCFTFIPKGEGVVLRDCLHIFCRECLVGCVQFADDSTVKCPFRDNDYSCNYNLQEREIKALVPPDIFEKYLARSVKLAENQTLNSYHCKTPDCTGWCVFEDDVNTFLCPVCKKRNCINCAAIHDGIDCQTFQREMAIAAETDEDAKQSRLMLEKMIQRGEALDCPACHVVLLKKWGCDWVRCSYCKTEICWVTKGFRWGKGGKGDVSGGCKCGVNGVKCHPKCTYCH